MLKKHHLVLFLSLFAFSISYAQIPCGNGSGNGTSPCNAISLTLGNGVCNGIEHRTNNCGTFSSSTSSCNATASNNAVWSTFTTTSIEDVSVYYEPGNSRDMVMHIYTLSGTCSNAANLTEYDCVDDNGSATGPSGAETLVLNALPIGTYYVRTQSISASGTNSASFICAYTTTAPSTIGCGDSFTDTGGSGSIYSSGENETWTICPDTPGDLVSVNFTSFLVEGAGVNDCWDFLYVYDGNSTGATPITPLSLGLGSGTSGFCWQAVGDGTADLTGETITSSDPTGCLTFNFTSDGSGQYAGWVASITCSPPPTCLPPSAMASSSVTSSSANLTWTAGSSGETNWNIEWGAGADFTPGTSAETGSASIATSPTYSMTGLSSNTTYYIYYQADCGGGDQSTWLGPITFTTSLDYCGGDLFTDSNPLGNYSTNENTTWTICPDSPGDVVSVSFTSFVVEGNGSNACFDFLYIYDGNSVGATPITPLSLGLGSGTSGFCWQAVGDGTADLTGETITSSDPSGCLTFNFTSDGSVQNAGWEATVFCGTLDYATNWISSSTGSANWCPGETRTVSVTVENNGVLDWTDGGADDFSVGVKWSSDPSYLIKVDAQDLTAGSTQTYSFSVTAPAISGPENLNFDVIKEGCFNFADNSTACGSTAGPGNLEYSSPSINIQAGPTSVSAGLDTTICLGSSVALNGSAVAPLVSASGTVTYNYSGSGFDQDRFQVGGVISGLPTGAIITSMFYDASINSNSECLSSWYDWDLHINGVFDGVSYGCLASGVEITSLNGQLANGQDIYMESHDLDGFNDFITEITFDLTINYDYDTIAVVDYAWTPTTGLDDPAIANPIASPTATTTYTLTASSAGCDASDDVLVNVTAASTNAVLVNGTGVIAEEQCTELDGWTYYATLAEPDEYLFGIKKNGSSFNASVQIQDEPGTSTYVSTGGLGPDRGTFLIGRYWDVVINSGSVSTPVDVRFFVDPLEVAQASLEADAFLGTTAYASYKTPLTFFKTPHGQAFDPITGMSGGNFTFTPANTWITPSSGLLNGVTYYELTGITGFSGGSGGFSVNDDGSPLPVELLYFEAEVVDNDYVLCTWSTATEINNDGFELMRSTDGINFEKIAWIDGQGNSMQTHAYAYRDYEVSKGKTYYYQLKQVDFDGGTELFNIVPVHLTKEDVFNMGNFIPNPSRDNAHVSIDIELSESQTIQVEIYSAIGKKVSSISPVLEEGKNTLKLAVGELAKGTYFVRFEGRFGSETRKLTIVK